MRKITKKHKQIEQRKKTVFLIIRTFLRFTLLQEPVVCVHLTSFHHNFFFCSQRILSFVLVFFLSILFSCAARHMLLCFDSDKHQIRSKEEPKLEINK